MAPQILSYITLHESGVDWSSLICSQDQVEGLMQQAADEAGWVCALCIHGCWLLSIIHSGKLMSVLIKGVISFHGFGIVDFRFSVNDFPSSANGDMIPLVYGAKKPRYFLPFPAYSLDLKMELPSNPTGIASSTAEQVQYISLVPRLPRSGTRTLQLCRHGEPGIFCHVRSGER